MNIKRTTFLLVIMCICQPADAIVPSKKTEFILQIVMPQSSRTIEKFLSNYSAAFDVQSLTDTITQLNYTLSTAKSSEIDLLEPYIHTAAEFLGIAEAYLTSGKVSQFRVQLDPTQEAIKRVQVSAALQLEYWAASEDVNNFVFDVWDGECDEYLPLYSPFGLNTISLLNSFDVRGMIGQFQQYMMKELADQHFQGSQDPALQGKRWTGDMLFNQDSTIRPFVQRKILQPDGSAGEGKARVFCCSDIHGDIHSLNAFLRSLIESHLMSNNAKLTNQSDYLIFQGDYVDGGWYGLEVLYLLMVLKLQNPGQVILIRGNHEAVDMNSKEKAQYYTFAQELYGKDSSVPLAEIAEIYKWMPVAAYIGMPIGAGKQPNKFKQGQWYYPQGYEYSLHSHAYVEIGFDPNSFLQDRIDEEQFCFIPPVLKRPEALNKMAKMGNWQPLLQASGWRKTSSYSKNIKFLNFLYGDIELKEPFTTGISSVGTYIAAYGRDITEAILKFYSKSRHALKMMVRGHQHSPFKIGSNELSDVFIDVVKDKKGFAAFWPQDQITPGKLWDGMVLTLWSSPLNMFRKLQWNNPADPGVRGKIPPSWDFQSIVLLTMSTQGFADWKLEGINIPIDQIVKKAQIPTFYQIFNPTLVAGAW